MKAANNSRIKKRTPATLIAEGSLFFHSTNINTIGSAEYKGE